MSLSYIEVKAIVFKLIKANEHRTAKKLMDILKEELPEVDMETFRKIFEEFLKL